MQVLQGHWPYDRKIYPTFKRILKNSSYKDTWTNLFQKDAMTQPDCANEGQDEDDALTSKGTYGVPNW